MTEQRRLRRHSVLVRRSLALGMSGVDVSPLLKTTLAHEDQTWWRVTHAGAFTLGGLFFWIGTFLYYYPDASAFGFDELKLSAWLYIVGSWFGPVSLSVPTVMVSKLVGNMAIMGAVLDACSLRDKASGSTSACSVGATRAKSGIG